MDIYSKASYKTVNIIFPGILAHFVFAYDVLYTGRKPLANKKLYIKDYIIIQILKNKSDCSAFLNSRNIEMKPEAKISRL